MLLDARGRANLASSLNQIEALIATGDWDIVAEQSEQFVDTLTLMLATAEGSGRANDDTAARAELTALQAQLQSIAGQCIARREQVRPLLQVLTDISNRAHAP